MTKIKIKCLECEEEIIFDMNKLNDIEKMMKFFDEHDIRRKITILDNGKSKIYKKGFY